MNKQVVGYDANFVTELLDHMKCPTCLHALKKLVHLVDCGHRMCQCCYDQLKDYAQTRYFVIVVFNPIPIPACGSTFSPCHTFLYNF